MMSSEYEEGSKVPESSLKLFNDGFPVRLVEHCNLTKEVAELHLNDDDFWLCLEGEAQFILGGKLVKPRDLNGLTFISDSIEGGELFILKPGDWLHVPVGQPHQPITPGRSRLVIIKIPAREVRED